jgi:hypothetical protein
MKIAAMGCLLAALALGAQSGQLGKAEADGAPRVGSLREFDRFTFEGANSFSARSLWIGLNSTFAFPELSHPLAPRDAFLAAIESRLLLGYEHCGFPDARITARYDGKADRVIVQIKEGPRYRCGPVEVIGARKMPAQPIVKALTVTKANTEALPQPFQFLDNAPGNRTEAMDTDNSSIWVEGQPAHFDDLSLQFLSGKVTNTLGKHGFFLSRFRLNVVSNAVARTATLQVRILSEGPPATIGRIEVVGNRRNSRKALLNYLDLKPGMGFTTDLAAAINDRLYHSARVLTNSVLAGTPDSSGRLKLTLEVVENDECPPLNGEFEPKEKAMLKARDWLAKVGETGEEAVLSVSGYSDETATLQCILAPRQGLLVLDNVVVSGTNRLRHALIVSSGQVALYAPERHQKFVTHFSSEQFQSHITVETHAPDPNGHRANLTIGAACTSLDEAPGAPPYALSMSLAPAAFLRLAHGTNFACRLDGDQLIRSDADSVLKLDARTGRFIEFTASSRDRHPTQTNLRFTPDAFAPALARIEHDGAGFINVCRTNAPFGSGVAFFGSELVSLQPVDSFLRIQLPASTCVQLPALLRRLGAADFLSPFENFKHIEAGADDPAGKFEIPDESRPVNGGTVGAGMAEVAQWVLNGGDLIFPPRSWPWTVSRDIAFVFRGQQSHLQSDMLEIYDSDETGPLGYLATARFLKHLELPLSKTMAVRGLRQLSTDAFRRDCRLFLDEHYVAGRFVARLAATLGDLEEQELDALVEPMSAAQAEFIRDCARRLRAAKSGQPLFETIAPALDAYWEKALKQNLADHLKKIANE